MTTRVADVVVVVVLQQSLSVEVVLAVAAASAGHQCVSDTDRSTETQKPFRPSYATRGATDAGAPRPGTSYEWLAEAANSLAECCGCVLMCGWSMGGAIWFGGSKIVYKRPHPGNANDAHSERGGENGKVGKREREKRIERSFGWFVIETRNA